MAFGDIFGFHIFVGLWLPAPLFYAEVLQNTMKSTSFFKKQYVWKSANPKYGTFGKLCESSHIEHLIMGFEILENMECWNFEN